MDRPAAVDRGRNPNGRSSTVLAFLFLQLGFVGQTLSQQRVVFGLVIDSVTGGPIAGAQAYFTTIRSDTRSGVDGLFILRGDNSRDSVLVIRRIGYVPRTIIVSPLTRLPAIDVGTVYLRPVATRLDEIAVVTEEVRRYPQLDGFYDRRKHLSGLGHFLTRESIERSAAMRASDVLRRSNKVNLDCTRLGGTQECAATSRRSREMRLRVRAVDSTYTNEELGPQFLADATRCKMDLWVDGVRSPLFDVDDIPVPWIVGIEIYSGPETTPVVFGQGPCGVIAIWTAVPGS